MPKLAVFVSGTGSLLKAIIEYPLAVDIVLADRECPAIQLARDAGIRRRLVLRKCNVSLDAEARDNFSESVAKLLWQFEAGDIAAMAGFGTVLSPVFFQKFKGTLLNTHPALLPAFKGNRAVRQALTTGAIVTGCTVHIATERLDDGPILAQQEVQILGGDTETVLHERIKAVERVLYPKTIAGLLEKSNQPLA